MCNPLLDEERMVQPEAVGELASDDGIVVDIGAGESGVEEPILVFEFVAERGLGPVAGNVVALVVKAGSVDVCEVAEEAVREIKDGDVATAIGNRIFIESTEGVLEPRRAMVPVP